MKALFGVELSRLSSRRAVRVLFIVAAAGIGIGAGIVFFRTGVGNEPQFKWTETNAIVLGLSPLLMVMAWGIGATSIGAEWGSKTITTTLTWEPRRVRLFVMKALATAAVVFVLAVTLQALLVGSLYPAAAKGTLDGVNGTWAVDLITMMSRIGLVAALTSLIAFAIAAIGRNSAAALGIGFVYIAVIEALIRGLKPNWAPWLLGENSATLILGGGADAPVVDRSAALAAVVVGMYVVALLSTAALSFVRRDVA